MKPQDYSGRTAYRPPATWYRHVNKRLGVFLTSLGLAPRDALTLEVRGRRSGKLRRTPVLRTPYQGAHYVVSLAGESEWVRNVRANAGHVTLRRRGSQQVKLVEVPAPQRPPIIAEYLRRGGASGGSGTSVMQARYYFGLGPDPSEAEIQAVVDYYPVFRIVS